MIGSGRAGTSISISCFIVRFLMISFAVWMHILRSIGSGVGAALMTACIEEATRRRYDGIWLGVWGKNIRAIRFYSQWGFVQVGTQPFVLGNDRQTDLVLWLPLDVPPR